jgi:hypothetical protein
MSAEPENSEVSMTYGDLYKKHPILADCIDPHEWDNLNLSEQRNWALSQADGHKTQRFKDALEASKIISVWTERALAAEAEITNLKHLLSVSEDFRKAYADGKYKLYAMGGEICEAAAEHLPMSEGPLERACRTALGS